MTNDCAVQLCGVIMRRKDMHPRFGWCRSFRAWFIPRVCTAPSFLSRRIYAHMDKTAIQDTPVGEWVKTLNVMYINGWRKRIEEKMEKGELATFVLDVHDVPWIETVLVPLLKREGLVVGVEQYADTLATRFRLCVYLQ